MTFLKKYDHHDTKSLISYGYHIVRSRDTVVHILFVLTLGAGRLIK